MMSKDIILAAIFLWAICHDGSSRQWILEEYDSIRKNGRICEVNRVSDVDLRIIFSYPTPPQKSN